MYGVAGAAARLNGGCNLKANKTKRKTNGKTRLYIPSIPKALVVEISGVIFSDFLIPVLITYLNKMSYSILLLKKSFNTF